MPRPIDHSGHLLCGALKVAASAHGESLQGLQKGLRHLGLPMNIKSEGLGAIVHHQVGAIALEVGADLRTLNKQIRPLKGALPCA